MIGAIVKKFSNLKDNVWPFSRIDFKKILPLLLIKFLASLIYTILTNMKDTLNITAKGAGAEIILVLKGWVVLPIAMIVAVIFSKLSGYYSKKKVFYIMLSGFLGVIALYGFLFYPFQDFFLPHASADKLTAHFGHKYEHWISVYRNWIHAILFVTAELWASVMILLLFWGLANDVSTVAEARKSYNIYIAAGDIAAFSGGMLIWRITTWLRPVSFIYTVETLIILVLAAGLSIMAIYRYMEKNVLTDSQRAIIHTPTKNAKKERITLRESIRHLLRSRYLLGIAVLVISYGLCISLVEVTWKESVRVLFPKSADYQAFTSRVQSMVGLFAFLISAFFGSAIIHRIGWRLSAQITPFLVGISGFVFLAAVYLQQNWASFLHIDTISFLTVIVFFGAFQNVASKVCKYSFFDPTKEMAFIPLDQQSKTLGKAAIDVVGSRLGKSGASWIQIIFLDLIGNGSIFSIVHILMPIVFIATVSWMRSVRTLSHEFEEARTEKL
ncbi:MAG: hypothetical protein A3F09_01660 [Chlamydiae bacterium RIFCSPHIGHO2_12_FULL_49_11]|nr:MAG: hypothetical protein A3F09_01660 [Chlamydiae bacterium RIFCSPHIGHO2_12_FULL_49_11]